MDLHLQLAGVGGVDEVLPGGHARQVVVVVLQDPAAEVLGGREGDDLAVLAQKHRGAAQVGAQRVHALALDGDLHRVDAGAAPRGGIVRVFRGGARLFVRACLLSGRGAGFGGGGDGGACGCDALGVELLRIDDTHRLVQRLDHILPVRQHNTADAGPLGQAVFSRVVVGAAVDVAQNRVGGEEDLRLLRGGNVRQGAGDLEHPRQARDVFVARAAGQELGCADDVEVLLVVRHHAVVALGLELLPLRVVR